MRLSFGSPVNRVLEARRSLSTERLLISYRSAYIPGIAFLRALSALLVMLYHFGFAVPAGLGVTCFFVISGFLITRLLLLEVDATGAVSVTRFYGRRAFRIFPAFYVYWVVVTAGLVILKKHIVWGQAISSLFYVCNYYQGLHGYPSSAYSKTWSLAVEEQFYTVWPLVFSLLALQLAPLLRAIALAILSIWVLRIVLGLAGVSEAYLYTAFECRADAILVGSGLAVALRAFPAWVGWATVCGSPLKLVATLTVIWASFPLYQLGTQYRDMVGHAIEPLLLATVLVQVLALSPKVLHVLEARAFRFLGAISYSTYLYHGLFPLPASAGPVLKILAAYAVASVSYFLVEKPFLALRGRCFRRGESL